MEKDEKLLEEYRNVNENMRHYGNMRFKELTLFNALNGALVAGFLVNGGLPSGLYALGMTIVVLFALFSERSNDYWHRFRKRAQRIDSLLGFRQHRDAPVGIIFTATNATRALYFVFVFFWAYLLTEDMWFQFYSRLTRGQGLLVILCFYVILFTARHMWVRSRYQVG